MAKIRKHRPEQTRRYYLKHGKDRCQRWKKSRSEFVQWVKLGVGCVECGFSLHPEALQFDHVRGVKLADISALVNANRSWDIIVSEMQKCDIVCANCHAVRTAERRTDVSS
jgi:hypothetical protein